MNRNPSDTAADLCESEAYSVGAPWALSSDRVLEGLGSTLDGLPTVEVERRLNIVGSNQIAAAEKENVFRILFRQFNSLVVWILLAACGVSVIVADWVEAVAILVVILLNGIIGFVTEHRAARSMEALRMLSQPVAQVLRKGNLLEVPSEMLVPGDIVPLEAGDVVPADLRLLEQHLLEVDESALTGESFPVRKLEDPIRADAILAERANMVFGGTRVMAGNGKGVVTATGTRSALGEISELVAHAGHRRTPLEKKLDRLSYRLIWLTLALTAGIALAGIASGEDIVQMIQTSLALAVAAIPEGLPVVATMALAHGMWKMARRNALINRLSAVEILGSTSTICTDKTGTLTENRMTLHEIWHVSSDHPARLVEDLPAEISRSLRTAVLCNNADFSPDESILGDPLEVALLEGAKKAGVSIGSTREQNPRIEEIPFDARTRIMATYHGNEGTAGRIAVKGAPEAVLDCCRMDGAERAVWENRNLQMAENGMRVIAIASRVAPDFSNPFSDLEFEALLGLIDPPRAEVPQAIARCQRAGIRVVMITGDQMPTASAVAGEVGIEVDGMLSGAQFEALDPAEPNDRACILQTSVFARATPEQKLKLISLYQEEGEIVAMTGDGVNDAPALQQADIGIAMGLRGTEVAREASDMVLRDDSFATIVDAIRQGRTIFSNIRKFVSYLISCNVSEILVVALATVLFSRLPILPLQILFLNLVTDVFPALALGLSRPSKGVVERGPRPAEESILRPSDWRLAGIHALWISVATLSAFWVATAKLGQSVEDAITVSFLTLAVAQMLHVFNMAEEDEGIFGSTVVRNRWVWFAQALCTILLALACYLPALAEVLELRPPGWSDFLVIFGFSLVPVFLEVLRRTVVRQTFPGRKDDE